MDETFPAISEVHYVAFISILYICNSGSMKYSVRVNEVIPVFEMLFVLVIAPGLGRGAGGDCWATSKALLLGCIAPIWVPLLQQASEIAGADLKSPARRLDPLLVQLHEHALVWGSCRCPPACLFRQYLGLGPELDRICSKFQRERARATSC